MPLRNDEFIEVMGEAAARIGAEDFYQMLLAAAGTLIDWDNRLAIRYSRSSAPYYVVAEDLPTRNMRYYLSGFYRVDPLYRYWRDVARGGVFTSRDPCTRHEYRKDVFDIFRNMIGMAGDLSILLPSTGSAAIALIFEKSEIYASEDVEILRRAYPLFLGLHRAHQQSLFANLPADKRARPQAYKICDTDGREVYASPAWKFAAATHPQIERPEVLDSADPKQGKAVAEQLTLHVEALDDGFVLAPGGKLYLLEEGKPPLPPIDLQDAFDSFLVGILTPRERQIVELILSGYPTLEIARRLAISAETVKKHRMRLYHKLDITTERELFSSFVTHLMRPESGPK